MFTPFLAAQDRGSMTGKQGSDAAKESGEGWGGRRAQDVGEACRGAGQGPPSLLMILRAQSAWAGQSDSQRPRE